MKKTQLILGFFLLLSSSQVWASITVIRGISFDSARLHSISESYRWNRLVGYFDENLVTKNEDLYLSSPSIFSLHDELKESIREYLKFATHQSDYFCNAPARAIFLTFHFSQLPSFDSNRCHAYQEWAQAGKIESISLMYVTGYLKNPASFFGHTLLKFNTSENGRELNLLESSLNYGAKTNGDATLPYIVRGLTGRYSASLSREKFFRLSAEYQEFQKRDIYEYRLKLTEFQKRLIVAYAFEMSVKEYIYYFLSDNCAYRLNLILGVALNYDPIPNLPWSSPIDLLMGVNDSGVVDKIAFHPSQTTTTRHSIARLDDQAINEIESILQQSSQQFDGEKLSTETKIALLEILNYHKIDSFKDGDIEKVTEIDDRRKKVLLSFNDNELFERAPIQVRNSPHEIDRPTLVRFGLRKAQAMEPIYTIQLRASNFELLDIDATRRSNSEFVFLSPRISIQDGNLRLDELTLFKVLSLNDSHINIPGESNFAWGAEVGRSTLSDACYPCSVYKATGTFGKALYLTDNFSIYALGNLSTHESTLGSGSLSMSAQAGLISEIGPVKINLDVSRVEYDSSSIFDDEEITMGIKFDTNYHTNFTFNVKKISRHWSFGFDINRHF